MKLQNLILTLCFAMAAVDACPTLYLSRSNISGVMSSSHGFPRVCGVEYCHNLNCNYELVPARNNSGRGVIVRFDYFNTESYHDFVRLEYINLQGQLVTGQFSGSVGSFRARLPAMQGTPVRMRWNTDSSVNSLGFLMRFHAVPAPPVRRYRLGGMLEVSENGVRGSVRVEKAKRK
ncbi:hypothetical protein BOX15_Mlig005918g1 [Macrostomum lignano]|uniref:CUB domain-containing protein n=2 Tax=Macrostomum lignano TaxID=282301 RepID=A0A1I8GB05_9PLAT|nr:hypothetical protein BOX15_Mlig005918g1 [Macrostomum lignano]